MTATLLIIYLLPPLAILVGGIKQNKANNDGVFDWEKFKKELSSLDEFDIASIVLWPITMAVLLFICLFVLLECLFKYLCILIGKL